MKKEITADPSVDCFNDNKELVFSVNLSSSFGPSLEDISIWGRTSEDHFSPQENLDIGDEPFVICSDEFLKNFYKSKDTQEKEQENYDALSSSTDSTTFSGEIFEGDNSDLTDSNEEII